MFLKENWANLQTCSHNNKFYFLFLISFSFEGQNSPIDHRAKPSRTEKPRASRGASPASERDGNMVFGGH